MDIASIPHPITILHDYSKTIITLGSSFLALSVTLMGPTLFPIRDRWQGAIFIFVFLFWLALALVILAGARIAATVALALRYKIAEEDLTDTTKVAEFEAHRAAAFGSVENWADWSYRFILAALAFFLVFGVLRALSSEGSVSAKDAVEVARDYLDGAHGLKKADAKVQSLQFDDRQQAYEIVVEGPTHNKYKVKVLRDRRVISDTPGP